MFDEWCAMRVYYKDVRRTEEIVNYSMYECERSITCFRDAICEQRGCLANDKKMASVRVFTDVRVGSRLLGERASRAAATTRRPPLGARAM